MSTLLIKNGECVTATDKAVSDIFVKDGVIAAVGPDLDLRADRVVDASSCLVFPGGIDVHTHLEMPFMGEISADDFETGTAAALAGGTTSLVDYVVPGKGQSLLEALATWHAKAEKAVADYGFHMAITWYGEQVADEMAKLVQEEGIPSFKAFLAYKGAIMVDDEELMGILKRCAEVKALLMAHCENGTVIDELQKQIFEGGCAEPIGHALSRPSWCEGESASRLVAMARAVGAPIYFVHMSAAECAEVLVDARAKGLPVYGETCPQYLLLDESVYTQPDFRGAAYVMSPPIRPKGHDEALWGALTANQIEVVATDHCPFNLKGQKELGCKDFRKIPNGAAGLQNRMELLYTYGVLEGRMNINQFVNACCTRPAQLFGMYPRKGSLNVGADADITVWDPAATGTISAETHKHNVDTNIFEGFATKGAPAYVVAAGKVQYENGDLKVEKGAGKFISRKLDHHVGY
jgi:dihydropyrimidinase